MRKLVSISAVSSALKDGQSSIETLYGLADDGSVWAYTIMRGGGNLARMPDWIQLPSIPPGATHMIPPQK